MQYGLSTALHSVHTTGAYGSTGISGIGLHGVHTAPKGSTTRVASIRDDGHAFHERRTPSFFSSSAKSIATARPPRSRGLLGNAAAAAPTHARAEVLAARADETRSAKRRDSRLDFPASHAQTQKREKK
jgi:hypothetical protein